MDSILGLTVIEEDEEDGDEERFEDRENMGRLALRFFLRSVTTVDNAPDVAMDWRRHWKYGDAS